MRRWIIGLLLGCGGTEAPAAPPADSGVEAAIDAAPDTSTEPIGIGRIQIAPLGATASFARNIPTTVPATCTRASFGPCDVIACEPAPPPESPAYESAGALTLSGGNLAAPLTIPRTSQTYAHTATTRLFRGGDDVRIKAAGDVVPAFELSVTTPEDLVVTKPACAADCGALDRATDYEITWTPLRYGDVEISLFTNKPATGYAWITCSVPAKDGRAVVPRDALAKLRTDATESQLTVRSRSSDATTIEGWSLTLTAVGTQTTGSLTIR